MTILSAGACVFASAQVTPTRNDSPVAQVRNDRSWEYGPFVNFGNSINNNHSKYWFFATNTQLGKMINPPVHTSILSDQFELKGNVMPF